jgi:hypothetical protein
MKEKYIKGMPQKEYIRNYMRKYRKENPEYFREYAKDYNKKHPELKK